MSIHPRHLAALGMLLIALFANPITASAQIPDAKNNPTVMAQINSLLASKGLTQEEVKERLKTKGINVDAMSEAEIMQNRSVIEQTVAELEAEKKKASAEKKVAPAIPEVSDPSAPAKSTPGVVDPSNPVKVIESSPSAVAISTNSTASTAKEPITTKAEAVADAVQKATVQKAPEVGIYGHDIFTNQTLEAFRTTDGARAPDTYILGTGDKIRITIFGVSQTDLLLEINKEGYVQPTGLKQMYLQGLSLAQARVLIGQRFGAAYRFQRDQYVVTLQTARAIMVNVFGETNQRGSFNMSALNTAFNALAVAGGPTIQGSIRSIELIRGNTRKKMDVYAYLRDPAVQFQYDIQQNDILYVPMSQKVVTLEGAVKRPMKYELTGKEGLSELIAFAGGVNFNTYVEFVQIQRAQADSVMLLEYKLADVLNGKLVVELRDGDVVSVRSAAKPLERFTEISGAVFYPGRYELQPDMSLGQLLAKVQLTPEAFTRVYFVERSLRDGTVKLIKVNEGDAGNFMLDIKDRVQVFNKALFANQEVVEVSGSVRQPFTRNVAYGDRISLSDALQLAGGLTPTAADTAFVIRKDLFQPGKIKIFKIIPSQPGDFMLEAGDLVQVYDRSTYSIISSIEVAGSVRKPFTRSVAYGDKISLADALEVAGGISPTAADMAYVERRDLFEPGKIEFFKVIPSKPGDFMLEAGDILRVYDRSTYAIISGLEVTGAIKQPFSRNISLEDSIRLEDAIQYAGGLLPTTYEKAQLMRRSPFTPEKVDYLTVDLTQPGNFQLRGGDKLVVYDKRTFTLTSNVTLSGAVKTPINTTYDPSLTLEEMIRMGGGFTRSAALNRVDVFRLGYGDNGSGYTRYQLELDSNYKLAGSAPFTLMPYDQVIVRDLPMFRLDRTVQLTGEVKYPGSYALGARRTHLSSVIKQAGGLNRLADKNYALLIRAEGNKGLIGVNLKKMRHRKGSNKFDPILLPGDVVTVSPYQNTMGIRLRGTRQDELRSLGVIMDAKSSNDVSNFSFRGKRNARWYIKKMAGGFDKKADRNKVTITYPDGSIRGTKKSFLFFRDYPTVKPGSLVSLSLKKEKIEQDKKGADWDKLFTKIISAATAMALILTATK